MNINFSKVISVATAVVLMFVTSSSSLKTITDEVKVNAAETKLTGDVNENNNVDVFDLIRVKRSAINLETDDNSAFDITGDNCTDQGDVRDLQHYLLCRNDSLLSDVRNEFSISDTVVVSENQPIETSVTVEIASIADELGDAVSVYNYLYNNMRSEFYYGSKKGAIGTFEQGGGNDTDLSSLLIAMLRYLGYEADYVTAMAGFDEEQIKKWTNTEDTEIADKILSSQKRPSVKEIVNGIQLYIYEYKYVRLIDAEKTYYLDICFKEYQNQESIYCQTDNSFADDFSLENINMDLFENEITKIEQSVSDLEYNQCSLYSKTIVLKEVDKLSTDNPHFYDSEPSFTNQLTQAESNNIKISFNEGTNQEKSVTISSAELYKKNITVSYEVSDYSKLTAETFELFGEGSLVDTSSIFNLPTQIYGSPLSVVPLVKIDGELVLTGPDLYIGNSQKMYISTDACGKDKKKYTATLTAGEMCSIVIDTGNISSNELSEAYIRSLTKTETVNNKYNYYESGLNSSDKLNEHNIYNIDYLGSMLRLTGVMYFSQVDIMTQALSEKTSVNYENSLRFGIVGYKPTVYSEKANLQFQGVNYGIQKSGVYYTDILGNDCSVVSKKGNITDVMAFGFERGLASSELESSVIEEILNVDALSTAVIFRNAQEKSIPIVTLSKDSEFKVSDLNCNSDDKSRIQSEIDAGNSVLATQSEVSIGKWRGIGYIVFMPDGVSQKYMIAGGYNGGSSIDPVTLYYLIDVALDLAMIAESVLVLTGILAAMTTLAFGPMVLALLATASITFLFIDILEQSLLLYDYEVNGNIESGREIQVNLAVNSVLTLGTMGIGRGVKGLSNIVSNSRLSRTYGSSTIKNIRSYGFNASEIGSKVKKFKSFGMTQSTIDALLKDSKCMYLSDDVLKVIGERGGNQRILAEMVLRNGDDFSAAVLKTNVIDEFCDLAWKYGDNASKIIICNDTTIKKVSEMTDSSLKNYFRTIDYITQHRPNASSEVLSSLYNAESRTTCRALNEIGNASDDTIRQNIKKFRSCLGKQKKSSNVGYANVKIEGVSEEIYSLAFYEDLEEAMSYGAKIENYPMAWAPENSPYIAFEVPNSPGQNPYLRTVCTEYKILSEIEKQISSIPNVNGEICIFTELECCESCSDVIAQFLERHPNIKIDIIHNNGTRLIPD